MMDQSPNYKPADHSDVSTYIMADEPDRVGAFIVEVLQGRETMRMARPDGTLMHAEYLIGDSVVMLSGANDQYPAFPVWLHVYVPDVDETYRKAIAFGAISVEPPRRGDDPDRRGGVKDAAGNIWWISTHQR